MNETPPGRHQRIVLAGFMGSGKSTVGRELAWLLGWRFADLDEAVSLGEGLTVPEIFTQHGEAYFRRAETEALEGLLQRPFLVIALGGGAPETPAVRALLAADALALVVHLHAPVEVLFSRCVAQAAEPAATARPLLGSLRAAALRYERRAPLYAAIAHDTVDVSESDAPVIAATLLDRWGR